MHTSQSSDDGATGTVSPSGWSLSHALKYAPWAIILLFTLFGAITIMDFPPVHYLGDEIGMMDSGADFMDIPWKRSDFHP